MLGQRGESSLIIKGTFPRRQDLLSKCSNALSHNGIKVQHTQFILKRIGYCMSICLWAVEQSKIQGQVVFIACNYAL